MSVEDKDSKTTMCVCGNQVKKTSQATELPAFSQGSNYSLECESVCMSVWDRTGAGTGWHAQLCD